MCQFKKIHVTNPCVNFEKKTLFRTQRNLFINFDKFILTTQGNLCIIFLRPSLNFDKSIKQLREVYVTTLTNSTIGTRFNTANDRLTRLQRDFQVFYNLQSIKDCCMQGPEKLGYGVVANQTTKDKSRPSPFPPPWIIITMETHEDKTSKPLHYT